MKKRYLILCIALWIAVIGIVPLNLFLISMSDIVIYAAVAAVIAALIAFILRANSKRSGKIVMSVISFLLSPHLLWADMYVILIGIPLSGILTAYLILYPTMRL